MSSELSLPHQLLTLCWWPRDKTRMKVLDAVKSLGWCQGPHGPHSAGSLQKGRATVWIWNVASVPRCQRLGPQHGLLGGGGTFRGWGLWESLPWRGVPLDTSIPLSPGSVAGEVSSLALPCVPATLFRHDVLHQPRPRATEPPSHAETSKPVSWSKPFFFLSWLSQIVCYSNGKQIT